MKNAQKDSDYCILHIIMHCSVNGTEDDLHQHLPQSAGLTSHTKKHLQLTDATKTVFITRHHM